jgi:hypothetical protein
MSLVLEIRLPWLLISPLQAMAAGIDLILLKLGE